jgi:hypothetical protein
MNLNVIAMSFFLVISNLCYPQEFKPNLSVITEFPKFPARPSSASFEMMTIEGKSDSTDRIFIQIYSDGQASVIANGSGKFFMHQGDGVFVSGNSKLLIDEKNNRIIIDGTQISNVMIVTKQQTKPVENMTYGERLKFPRPLSNANSELELQAACSSAANVFANLPNWYNKREQIDALNWSLCVDLSNKDDGMYLAHRSNWVKRLSKKEVQAFAAEYYSRCTRDYLVSFTLDSKYGKQCFRVTPSH